MQSQRPFDERCSKQSPDFDVLGEVGGKVLERAQVARHSEVEDGVQFAQVVLDCG